MCQLKMNLAFWPFIFMNACFTYFSVAVKENSAQGYELLTMVSVNQRLSVDVICTITAGNERQIDTSKRCLHFNINCINDLLNILLNILLPVFAAFVSMFLNPGLQCSIRVHVLKCYANFRHRKSWNLYVSQENLSKFNKW